MREKLYLKDFVTLKDGSVIYIRKIESEDFEKVLDLYRSLSPESLRFRFFSKPSEKFIEDYVRKACSLSDENYGVVAIHNNRIIGHAEFHRINRDVAEVAFTVADEFQRRGVGTLMLGFLAEVASRKGIDIFEANVLPENYGMLEVFRESGFPVKVMIKSGYIVVRMATSITEEVLEKYDVRGKIATMNTLKHLFYPRSVAIVGASRDRRKVGGKVLYNMLTYGFEGVVYPVNRTAKYAQGVKTYQSVLDIPDEVDLAVISVPAEEVIEVAEECGKKGVKVLVVLSAGFSEIGEKEREKKLLEVCRKYRMRLIGPNCMGIINTDPKVRLNATFAPNPAREGKIAFASQSGAVGLAVIDYVNSVGLGLSSFVSLGNRADISSNDLIELWEDDERTDVIMLYLESFGNPRKFARIAKRVTKKKPILAMASGLTPAGAKAVSSHTGALVSASGLIVDVFFKQIGVIRASALDELFAIADFLTSQPLPKGRNVAIVTNGGGLGAITSDWCEQVGLKVPDLSQETQKRLKKMLPPIASVKNPVDMTASANIKHYEDAVKIVAEDQNVDAIIIIFVQAVSLEETKEVFKSVLSSAKYANELKKPVIFVYVGTDVKEIVLKGEGITVPVFQHPNIAAKVLGKTVEYALWRNKPKEAYEKFEVDKDRAIAIVAASLGKREWMRMDDAFELLKCYGINVAPYIFVKPEELESEEVLRKVEDLGKVAVKIVSEKIVHKKEYGAVKLDLEGKEAVRVAKEMVANLKHMDVEGVVFQKMGKGVEMFVGVAEDPNFGPLITCGAGGELVEIFKDVSIRVTPITRGEAWEMVKSLKSYPLLTGYRSREAANVEAFVDLLLKINALVEDFAEIVELDCNPVLVNKDGIEVVDVRIKIKA
ncbi:MAG: GNAT family N-acetyltransferase [Archaeoglobaceae archaeon]|nr:GNAT family N-acetyltransferase [Archaeoglobaceae archaeon]MCX8152200.1 GNAT family N-acetyltransferase [Archaeoglobaceae archaeon]MDW8013916.1 GNAT family N-acetyltransferase [Archaeoglobaceae archaeon]